MRVIAATHQNLEERVARGLFREDLYHRLNVIRIELPPLRARVEDIPDLARRTTCWWPPRNSASSPRPWVPMRSRSLNGHDWPGNVRELVNLCRRLSVLAPGSEVHTEDLPPGALRLRQWRRARV